MSPLRISVLYLCLSTVIAVGALLIAAHVLLRSAADAANKNESLNTLTVHQIRVVDEDGTLRLLIANQEHFPSQGLIRGKPLHTGTRSVGSAASLFFYNRDGSEQGALRWDGRTERSPSAPQSFQYAALTLDQLEANDNLVLAYGEQHGKHRASVSGLEQPYPTPLDTLLMQYDTVGRMISDALARRRVREQFRRTHFVGNVRFSLGYDGDEASLVLADALGRPRLRLGVAADGTPRIQFLDSTGVVSRQFDGAGVSR